MYLKTIELQGFKSFAGKTVLHFNPGVTGIVGPNGSGKSNIADAVRWVLGEQKVKQLRGTSMQDVIFSGTELRKPLGFASVSLTLDNSDRLIDVDYTEISVSRRLYRSGESEYTLNGQPVRLKDIQELFYDTGIGREGYSIIGQGQIDAILNGRPEERRGVFDEAAGIIRFRRRRALSQSKLESEQADLLRITDILNELENQVGPLEEQSRSAREYLKLREELKTADINLYGRETKAIGERLVKNQEAAAIMKTQLEETKAESSTLKAEHEKISSELEEFEDRLSRKKDELQKAGVLIENLKGQIEVARAQILADEAGNATAAARLEKLKESEQTRRTAVLDYCMKTGGLLQEVQLLKERLTESTGETETVNTAEDREAMTDGTSEMAANARKLEEKLQNLLQRLSVLSGLSLEEIRDRIQMQAEENMDPSDKEAAGRAEPQENTRDTEDEEEGYVEPEWMKAIRNRRTDLSLLREKEARITGWMSRSSREYNELMFGLRELNGKISSLKQERQQLKAKLEALKSIAERYEGYGQTVKSIMQLKNKNSGILGVAADIIHTDRKYETAVETALGGRIQNIVTDTEKTAKGLIDYLKRNKLGRATFLPLDAVSSREEKNVREAAGQPGVLGTADELCTYEEKYEGLVRFLLGNILVADTIDNALKLAARYHHQLRIVTLEGESLTPGGAISGGAFKSSSNLIGRSRELKELQAAENKAAEQIGELETKAAETEKAAAAKDREIKELNSRLSDLKMEKNSISIGIVSEMRMQLSGIGQKTDFILENMIRLSEEEKAGREEADSLNKNTAERLSHLEERQAFISARNEDILHISEAREAAEKSIEEETLRRSTLSAAQSEYFKRREELNEVILRLGNAVMRAENELNTDQEKLDDATDYLWEEYEVTRSEALALFDETAGSSAELKKTTAALRGRIKALGPVNVQAIEEYKAVSERYGFLKGQYDDLKASEEAVRKIIAELDAGMRKQFSERFEKINEEFGKVFSELFGGGTATLELLYETDSADVLTAGIGINVQPPGKKLQNIMQLSGGEKTLTAIAILFAIQNLKPSPFCLLDEIEAALDEANIDHFARYLGKLSGTTQFIVITHRRGTMESADRLYGVTMQEKGITALVSVDLVDAALDR